VDQQQNAGSRDMSWCTCRCKGSTMTMHLQLFWTVVRVCQVLLEASCLCVRTLKLFNTSEEVDGAEHASSLQLLGCLKWGNPSS
jgi:hypothetical protein